VRAGNSSYYTILYMNFAATLRIFHIYGFCLARQSFNKKDFREISKAFLNV